MYLEYYYLFKGHLLLHEKDYKISTKYKLKPFISLCIEFNSKQIEKRSNLIFFILLNIWHINVNRYSIIIDDQNLIFNFLNTYLIIWLPLALKVKFQRLVRNTSVVIYRFDPISSVKLLEPLNNLISLQNTSLIHGGHIKLNLIPNLTGELTKENLSRFFKFPLYFD